VARERFSIDPDVRRASGPPPTLYTERSWFARAKDGIFARTWQCAGAAAGLEAKGAVRPVALLPGCLDESLLLARDGDGELRCLSNVCSHRGHRVVAKAGCQESLQCPYHGRRFRLNGRILGMPEFQGVEGFPGARDDLAQVACGKLGPLVFVALEPAAPLAEWGAPMIERLSFLPLAEFAHDSAADRVYEFGASWILYVDNYLEGFHIPFIHAGLNAKIDWRDYRTEIHRYCSAQIATAAEGEPAFEPPAGHRDHGKRIAAYYYWLFPGTMLNFYPWGLSLNVVEPVGPERTRVRFETYVWRPELREKGAGSGLDRVQAEDEAAVCSAQEGMRSRFAVRARYSPTQEVGTHHFHRLLAEFL
jgi:phenylpropionate dioxygenase-like ring-hydroxylating dioxygenase large terminal subunit